jgi:hypothetical protein
MSKLDLSPQNIGYVPRIHSLKDIEGEKKIAISLSAKKYSEGSTSASHWLT